MYIRINTNPRGSWLMWLLLLPLIVAAVIFGFMVFLVVLALVALALLGIFLRLWWLKRKLGKQAARSGALEGDYIVVREEVRHDRKPPEPPR